MPCKKNKQPPSKPKCTLSSWRLLDELETVPVQDLCQSAGVRCQSSKKVNEPSPSLGQSAGVCCPISKQVNEPSPSLCQSAGVCCPGSKQVNEPSPSESGTCICDNDVSAPVKFGALDPQLEESSRSLPSQEPKIPSCLSNSQAIEVEAMIEEIRICREIIRKLALEAMDILHPKTSQQCKQKLQAQQGPIANAEVPCCELYDNSEANPIDPASQAKPIYLGQKNDGSEKKCEPPTLSKSPAPSRKSSGPIAQTACQIKDCRLGQTVVRKKPSNYSCDGEKKQNVDCSCDETMSKNTLGKKPSNCGCDGGKKKKPDCLCDEKSKNKMDCKTLILDKYGNKPSNYCCDGEKTQNIGCRCDETMNKNTLGKTPINCGCDDGEKKQNINCSCDETMMKQNKENEKRENKTDSKSCLKKTFGSKSSDIAPSSVAAACAKPTCAANTCTCHFPPAYSQYFDCTGHVSGNCHCDKNA